jgi:hypothetical protein
MTAASLFVLGSSTGFIVAPLFPLSFAWIIRKLNVIPSLLAALLCGMGVGSLVLQKIGGRLHIKYFMAKLNCIKLIQIHSLQSSHRE